MPGGQDLHNVPCPGSCGRERVRTEPGARAEVPGKPTPGPKESSQDRSGRTHPAGLLSRWALPRGRCCWRGQRPGQQLEEQRALREQKTMASLGLSIYHPLSDVPRSGDCKLQKTTPSRFQGYSLTSTPHAASKPACPTPAAWPLLR